MCPSSGSDASIPLRRVGPSLSQKAEGQLDSDCEFAVHTHLPSTASRAIANLSRVRRRLSQLRVRLWVSAICCGLAAVLAVAGCGESESDNASEPNTGAAPSAALPAPTGGPGVGQPQAQSGCTKQASDSGQMEQAMAEAVAGDRICLTGDMNDTRLEIRNSGTPDRPIIILGGGKTTTKGITIEGNDIVVDGVAAVPGNAPGISIKGNNITLQNSTSVSPQGGDGDAIRFWGRNIKILHNTLGPTGHCGPCHADCFQTFATNTPTSQNVLIDSNRCEKIENICLIAEGPNADDGSHHGQSSNFTFSNNYCDNKASQATFVDDIQNVTISNNQIVGRHSEKAFAFQNGSTGAKVIGNNITRPVDYEVGMDDSSEQGYQGPRPGGGP